MYLAFLLIIIGTMFSQQTLAQEVLVCDAATSFPLRDVETSADGKKIGQTNYMGLIVLPDSFQTATFKRKGFLSETLTREEVLRDTVFLFPAENYLDEVVVTGKMVVNGAELLKKMPKRDILEAKPKAGKGAFDIGIMLDKRYRRDKKHVEQNRKIFKKLDGTDTEDPILRIYKEQIQKKRIEEQNKNKAYK